MTRGPGRLRKVTHVAVLVALPLAWLVACALPLPPKPISSLALTPIAPSTPQPAEKPPEKPTITPTSPPSKATGALIRIGHVTPLTGPLGPLGHLEKVSLLQAEEDISKEGGIASSPLQIIRYDSSDARQAAAAIRKLASEDRVLAILGPYSNQEMEAASSLANELQIPVIGMRATKSGESEKHRPWTFRLTVTDEIHTKAVVAAFKKLYPNIKKVLIVGDIQEPATGTTVQEVWLKYLAEAGYEVQGSVTYASGTTDYRRLVADIKDRKPEAIAYGVTPQGNPVGFAKELAAQQVKVPVMASVHVVPGLFVYQAAKEMEGWLSAILFNPTDPDLRVQDFIKRWQAAADADPDVTKPARLTLEANAYDALMVLSYIMRKANIVPDTPLQEARSKVRDGLQGLKDYRGVSGTMTMQPSGDATWPPTPVIARNGAWAVIR